MTYLLIFGRVATMHMLYTSSRMSKAIRYLIVSNLHLFVSPAQVLVGTCSSRFSTGLSGCIVGVSEQWFKDGESLEPKGNPLYFVSEPGDVLKILNLADETTGQYVCVTTLPWELGSFVTVDMEIELSDPGGCRRE